MEIVLEMWMNGQENIYYALEQALVLIIHPTRLITFLGGTSPFYVPRWN
jgi:hypothetical protein